MAMNIGSHEAYQLQVGNIGLKLHPQPQGCPLGLTTYVHDNLEDVTVTVKLTSHHVRM